MARYRFSTDNNTKKSGPDWADFGSSRPIHTNVPEGGAIPSTYLRSTSKTLSGQNAYRISPSIFLVPQTAAREAQRRTRRGLQPAHRLKRALDIVISSTLLILLLPLLLAIAALVRFSGPGPIIFRQKRIGARRKPFVLLKFRTMAHSAVFTQATIADPRVTAIGRLLRRLSFDEFLQLVNVIKGDMSLVGPRPHAPETRVEGILFEEAVLSYRARYLTKPGITGLAQIRGQRGETRTIQQLEDRVASDIEYIENWSIWLDLLILLKTLPAIFKQVNAY